MSPRVSLRATVAALVLASAAGSALAQGAPAASAATSSATPPGVASPPASSAPASTAPGASPAPASPAPASTAPASTAPGSSTAPAATAPAAPPERPLAADQARLRVAVNRPGTQVWIDGALAGTAPLERDLAPGVHRVRLASFGQRSWEGTVELRAGFRTPLRAVLRPAASTSDAWAVTSVAGALLLVGAGLAAFSLFDHDALEASRRAGRLDNLDPRIDRGEVLAGLADGMFVIGGLIGGLGAYFFAHDPGPISVARPGLRVAVPAERP